MKSTGQDGLQVLDLVVDQLEPRKIARIEMAKSQQPVVTSCVGHCREAALPNAELQGTRLQTGFEPIANVRRGESTDQVEFGVPQMSSPAERDSRHEQPFFRSRSGLAVGNFAIDVGIVTLDRTVHALCAVLLGHGAGNLLARPPRAGGYPTFNWRMSAGADESFVAWLIR
jgi:hypothetical protein